MSEEEREIERISAEIQEKAEMLRSINASLDENLKKAEHAVSEASKTANEQEAPPVHFKILKKLFPRKRSQYPQGDKNYRLNKYALRVQVVLCLATIAAFGAAWRYADIADQQKVIMDGQWQTLNGQWQTLRHQWATMNKTLAETQKQTLGVLGSADAAQKQIGIVQRQFSLDERPYITIELITRQLTAGMPVIVNLSVKNVGKSRALSVSMHGHMTLGNYAAANVIRAEPADPRHEEYIDPNTPGTFMSIVSAKDTFAIESINVPVNQLANWNGSDSITVFGRVTYADTFGSTIYCSGFIEERIQSGAWAPVNHVITARGNITPFDLCPRGTYTK